MTLAELERNLLSRLSARSNSGISRLSCEVAGEQVTFFVREGALRGLCTCGAARCEHYLDALQWLDPNEAPTRESAPAPDPRLRSSLRPPASAGHPYGPLADACDELLLAVVRSGMSAASSASVRDAIDRLTAVAPVPLPLGLSRWLGRLHEALQRADVGETARVLEGARIFTDELRTPLPTRDQLARRHAWLAPAVSSARTAQPLEGATLLEVAREWLAGPERNAIERRYLLDLNAGDVVREERARHEMEISVGPCPRVLHVAFGEVEAFGAPRRVRLLQYTVSARPSAQQWSSTEPFAKRLVRQVGEAYAAAVSVCPGLSEPFMLVAPRTVDVSGTPVWIDSDGERMALAEEAAQPMSDLLQQFGERGRIVWIAGRLIGLAQGLVLKPVSLLLQGSDGPHLMRVS